MISFNYACLKFCFVNSHLAAHQNTCELRNQNYRTIVKNIKLSSSGGTSRSAGGNVGGSNNDILNEFHHVVWFGDLNYRLDYGAQGDAKSPSPALFKEMVDKINSGPEGLLELWKHDQLSREMAAQRAFLGFSEGPMWSFEPTFKLKRAAGLAYTAQRSPAWCDRILLRSVPGFAIAQRGLGAPPSIHTSDHKPLVCFYDLWVPPPAPPLDRTLGAAIVRLHELRCSLLRVPKDLTAPPAVLDVGALALMKDVDPFLVFHGAFLDHAVTTPIAKKSPSPQWMELPPMPAVINCLERLRQTLLYVRVLNHQSQDAVIGRAVISLMDLHPEGFASMQEATKAAADAAAAAAAAAATTSAAAASGPGAPIRPSPSSSSSSSSSSPYPYRGQPHTTRFDVELTYAGMPAGSISGLITFHFKQKQSKR